MDADVPENYTCTCNVAQLSGHKNLKSLDPYETASASHQRNISIVLSRSAMATSAVNADSGSLHKHEAFILTSQSNLQLKVCFLNARSK